MFYVDDRITCRRSWCDFNLIPIVCWNGKLSDLWTRIIKKRLKINKRVKETPGATCRILLSSATSGIDHVKWQPAHNMCNHKLTNIMHAWAMRYSHIASFLCIMCWTRTLLHFTRGTLVIVKVRLYMAFSIPRQKILNHSFP